MKQVFGLVFIFLSYYSNGSTSISSLEKRFSELSVTNRILSSSVLLPELNSLLNTSNQDEDKVRAFILQSKIYLQYESYSDSLLSLLQAKELANQIKNPLVLAKVQVEQARLNIYLERYNEAISDNQRYHPNFVVCRIHI